MKNRNDNIWLKDLVLSNHKNVLSVSVYYSQRGKVIALRIQPLEREKSGFSMVALFGGPKSANVKLEDCGRFNEKRLVAIADDIKQNGKDSQFGEIYEQALSGVLDGNGYQLALIDSATGEAVNAYKAPEFVVGARVYFDNKRTGEQLFGWVTGKGIGERSGKTEYDVLLDNGQLWRNRTADEDGQPIVASGLTSDAAIASTEYIGELLAKYYADQREKAETKAREEAEKKAASESALAGVKAQYPWAKRDGSNHANAAANLKTQLQLAFPGVEFKVKSSSYSMGSSITASWTDGPTEKQVDEYASRYEYGNFDGMTDSYNSKGADGEFRGWMGSVKYASASRDISQKAIAAVTEAVKAKYGTAEEEDTPNYNYPLNVLHRSEIYGEFERLDYAENSTVDLVAIFTKPEVKAFTPTAPVSGQGVTVSENAAKAGIELRFASKPEPDVIARVKANGFRWSKFQKLWYAKANARTKAFAYDLAGQPEKGEDGPDYFDMAVEDRMAEQCFACEETEDNYLEEQNRDYNRDIAQSLKRFGR